MAILGKNQFAGTGAVPIINTFDFVDVLNGTGYIEFYLGQTSGAHLLSPIPFYCDQVISDGATSVVGSGAQITEESFDAEINIPTLVKGKLILNTPVGCQATAGGMTMTNWVEVFFKKWDGSTETEIASQTSRVSASTDGGGGTDIFTDMLTTQMTIPLTKFIKGDSMRVTVRQMAYVTGSTANFWVGHDPKGRAAHQTINTDRTFGTDNSIASVLIPFRIDLT